MILKILARYSPSYESLIRYILKDGTDEIFTHNLRSNTIPEWTAEFLENESWRKHNRSDQIYLYHDIISFSANEDKERITKDILHDIARKYIELRGTEGMYIGAVHRDKDHIHIHFCTSGLAYRTGTAFRLSKEKLKTLKQDLQEYHIQTYPELTESICQHGSGKTYLTDRAWQAAHKGQRDRIKSDVARIVTSCLAEATSLKDFLHRLRDAGLHHYERNGQAQGIATGDGIKFRFSRFGITKEHLQAMPKDTNEEQKALNDIRAIRNERNHSHEYER